MQERINEIDKMLQAIAIGWPFFMSVLNEKIESLTLQLIAQDNEQVRGRIKALRDLTELVTSLQQERAAIHAELLERDSAE